MSKTEVSFLVNSVPPIKNTTRYQHCLALCEKFETTVYTSGHTPKIITQQASEVNTPSDTNAVSSYLRFFIYLQYLYLIIKDDPQVIVTGPDSPHVVAGFVLSRLTSARWVIDYWDDPGLSYDYYRGQSNYTSYMYQAVFFVLYTIAKFLISRSHLIVLSMHPKVLSDYDTKFPKVVRLSNGVIELIQRHKSDTEHKQLAGDVKVVYTGSINRSRGVTQFINSLHNQSNKDVCLHVVGDTPKGFAKSIDMTDKNMSIKLHGRREWRTTLAIISESDICLLPLDSNIKNYNYSYPIKLFEYLSIGGAVLASSTVGIRNIVTDNENAILSDSNNINRNFNKLVSNPDLRNKISQNGHDLSKEYLWDDIVEKYVQSIESEIKVGNRSTSHYLPPIKF